MNTSLPEDTILYRFEPYDRIVNYIKTKRLSIVNRKKFDDPWEGFVFKCYLSFSENDDKSFLEGNRVFMMCFTDKCVKDSDALWRIYSNKGGVRFKTTAKKIKNIIEDRQEDYFLEKVKYDNLITDSEFFKRKNIIVRNSRDKNIIKSLFYKRTNFSHEHEIRLIAWSNGTEIKSDFIELDIEPDDLFDEIVFDPMTDDDEVAKRMNELRALGFNKTYKSRLYHYRNVFYKCY